MSLPTYHETRNLKAHIFLFVLWYHHTSRYVPAQVGTVPTYLPPAQCLLCGRYRYLPRYAPIMRYRYRYRTGDTVDELLLLLF